MEAVSLKVTRATCIVMGPRERRSTTAAMKLSVSFQSVGPTFCEESSRNVRSIVSLHAEDK